MTRSVKGCFWMSKTSANLGGNTGAMIAGGAVVVALALGAYIAFGRGTPDSVPVTAAVPQSDISPAAVAATPEQDQMAQAPRFDEVRRDPDGTTIIAGRAEPLSDVKILVDGAEVATAKADSTGGFAAIAMLPPNAAAQVVSLSASDKTHTEETASLDEIILAPSSTSVEAETPAQPAASDVAEAVPAAEEAIAEPARIAVLKSDAEGVRLLNPTKPQAMTSVALDTIGYSDLGDVQLTGRAQPDTASVRVYLDNRSVISLPVDAEGRWRGDLPDVDEGVYTLRVDEVSSGGAVSSRVETPFKRESAAVLEQAAAGSDGPIKAITVQAGATLWAIARERYGDGTLYLRVVEANADSIRDPDLIYPGQVFDLPN